MTTLDTSQSLRINVVGTSASGKSYFARQLARRLGCPHIEMDLLFWGPDWQPVPDELFIERLEQAISEPNWVLDGNYNRTKAVKYRRVNTVIWLDYSLPRTLARAVKRATNRVWTRRELWPGTGNRESFRRSFLSRESIILWTLQTYYSNRRRYLGNMRDPDLAHINFVQLRSPKQANQLLQSLHTSIAPD